MAAEQVFLATRAGSLRVGPTLSGSTSAVVTVSEPPATLVLAPGSGDVDVPVAAGATVTLDSSSPGAVSYRRTVERTATELTVELFRYVDETAGWIES